MGIFALLAVMIWVARYWHSGSFGLYEDDLTIIPRAVEMTLPDLVNYVISYIVHLYGHARPLSDSLIYIFSFLGWGIAKLNGIYWIGYAIVTFNSFLFYVLLKRLYSQVFAITGALAYCLFSADTTQAFLTHSLGLQPSLTLLLLAFHSYLSKKQWLSYVVVLVILFSYETPFPVFFAVPLLAKKWDKGLIKELIKHILILGIMVIAIFLLRSTVGEGRVAGLGFPAIVITPILHMIQGPVVSMGTYFYRPLLTLRALNNLELVLVIGLAFPVLAWVLSRIKLDMTIDVRNLITSIKDKTLISRLPDSLKTLVRLAVVGLVMLILAYPLTFTVRAYAISGRDTRVHLAAVVGASILLAVICTLVLYVSNTYKKKWLCIFILTVFFTLLLGYGFVVQRDYSLAWEYQKEFWTSLIPLIPDATNGTVILVDPSGLKDTRQIGANTWNLPRVLNQIFQYPADWKNPPRVYRLLPGWQDHIVTKDGQFQVNELTATAPPSLYTVVDSSDVILIETGTGRLVRRSGPLLIGDLQFTLKNALIGQPQSIEKGFLFDYLVQY